MLLVITDDGYFNSYAAGIQRDEQQLKKLWENLKDKTKRYEAKRIRDLRKTGFGSADIPTEPTALVTIFGKVKGKLMINLRYTDNVLKT